MTPLSGEHIHNSYFATRMEKDKKRTVLWQTLCTAFFNKIITKDESVLELGAGYCDFINSIEAGRKFAVDIWDDFPKYADGNVTCFVSSVTELKGIENNSIDFIICSNLIEHLTHDEIKQTLFRSAEILRQGGKIILIQPNFRLNPGRYFDDYTHVSIWTDTSLSDFLRANGWKVDQLRSKFLPLTVKTKFPVAPFLIKCYLKSPIKPLAGQMLLIASRADVLQTYGV